MTIVEYAQRRGAVAPFYTIIDGTCNCPSGLKKRGRCRPGKHPIVKKTKGSKGGYYRATRDLKQVQQWFKKWPWANIGLAMEPDLIAIDPDSRSGGDIVLKELEGELGELPATWAIQSGSGDVRYVFRLPVSLGSVKVRRDGMELEFIAGPGTGLMIAGIHGGNSATPPGNPYIDLGGEIAELPPAWIDYVRSFSFPSLKSYDFGAESEKGISFDLAKADPVSVAMAYWLWDRHYAGQEFPELGDSWQCWTHDDETPSALFLVKDGRVKIRCMADGKSYALADFYAREWGLETLTPGLLALFDAKLRLDSGAAPRPEVPYDPLGFWYERDDHTLFNTYIDFMACKFLDHEPGPMAFSLALASTLSRLPLEVVRPRWKQFRADGVIIKTGTEKIGNWPANLYLPQGYEKAPKNSDSVASGDFCQCGCGIEIQQGRGLPRKWASESCRKRGRELGKLGFKGFPGFSDAAALSDAGCSDDVTWEELANVDW
jgi:hypothetical protein